MFAALCSPLKRMGLHVALTRFRNGAAAPIEPEALARVTEAARAVAAEDPAGVSVTASDNGGIRLTLGDADGNLGTAGGDFRLTELTVTALELIFRLAQVADLTIVHTPGGEGERAGEADNWILTSDAQRAHLPAAGPGAAETVVCESVAELCALLRGGVGEWKKFREMIASGEF